MKVFISAAIAAAIASPAMAALPASVTNLIDDSVNPCTDFYQYSCGKWLKNNALGPADTTKDYSFSSVSKRNEDVIQAVVKEDWPLIGEFWDSCIDSATRNARGAKPLQPFLNKVSAATTKDAIMRVAGQLSRVGVNFVTNIRVNGDTKDATKNAGYLAYADPVLPDINTYFNPTALAALEPGYRAYIDKVMTLSGFSVNKGASQGTSQGTTTKAPTKSFADAVLNVEKTIILLLNNVTGGTGPDPYYNLVKIGDLTTKYPLSANAFFSGAGLTDPALTTLTSASNLISYYPNYYDLTEKALNDLPLEDIKTYVAFLFVNNRVRYLDDTFYDAYFQFFAKQLNGQNAKSTPESICVYRVKQYFPDLIGKYYFMKMFDNERQENAELLTKLIKKAMGDHISKLSWLDDATRAKATGKLNGVLDLIGQSKVKQSYPFTMDRTQYFENVDAVATQTNNIKLKKINTPVDRGLWSISPAEVNAYYSSIENKMVFPAAILQAPFFDGKAHAAQNFGSIGAVVGHELTHGFDSKGRNYDAVGNKINWWTANTTAEFTKRETCMKQQYASFPVAGQNGANLPTPIDGALTIGENIADNGGFGLTWDAFHEYAKTSAYDPKGVTPAEADKLLFLSFAQTWCGIQTDKALTNQLKTDPHSPGQWRANGVAINSPFFGPTFNCAVGTPMNPTTPKCQIW